MRPTILIALIVAIAHPALGATPSKGPDCSENGCLTPFQEAAQKASYAEAIKEARKVTDPAKWTNPWARIHAGTIELASGAAPRKTLTVPIKNLKKALLGLPSTAWPMGGIIAASESGPQGVNDVPAKTKKKTAEDFKKVCKSIGVEINWWP